jgi:hypothetical protein
MEDAKIQFISSIPHLSKIEECSPKVMPKSIPDWWKKTSIGEHSIEEDGVDFGNVKNCPSFPDYFSQGYYIPMWADTIINFDKKTGDWFWKTSSTDFKWEFHDSSQFIDFASPLVNGKSGYAVFKGLSPWSMITPQGYSVLQLPMFYNFNEDFTVLPGIFASDVEHTLNIQVLIHSDKKEIVIERGTPLAHYIPFKRDNVLPMEYRDATEEDKEKIETSKLYYKTKFFHGKEYLRRKKEKEEEQS